MDPEALDAALYSFGEPAVEVQVEVVEAEALAEVMEAERAATEDALRTPVPEPQDNGDCGGGGGGGGGGGTDVAALSPLEALAPLGEVVAGLWRPRPLEVAINGRRYIAYCTPSNLRMLPSGHYVVGRLGAGAGREGGEGGDEEALGDVSRVIICEPLENGNLVFMFGLTRTVLRDGSILYRFPSGRQLGKSHLYK